MKLVAQYFGADGLWAHFFARPTLLFISLSANGVNRRALWLPSLLVGGKGGH